MPSNLTVRLEFQISSTYGNSLLFKDWLPQKEDMLETNFDDLRINIWFDPIRFRADVFDNSSGDIRLNCVGMDVMINGVSDELAAFIEVHSRDTAKQRDTAPRKLSSEYERLGRKVMDASVITLNRFLAYCKVHKAQHWLSYYEVDPDNFAGFQNATDAKVRSDRFDWKPWRPSCVGSIKNIVRDWGWRKLQRDDFTGASDFLSSKKRPDLALELLATAEELAMHGYTRVPIIEAVAALEVALDRFLQSPCDEVNQTFLLDVEQQSLHSLGSKLGLRGQLTVLLPLVLNSEQLPRDILHRCRRAIDVRGTVVHQGTREIDPQKLSRYLVSLRELTMILLKLTA